MGVGGLRELLLADLTVARGPAAHRPLGDDEAGRHRHVFAQVLVSVERQLALIALLAVAGDAARIEDGPDLDIAAYRLGIVEELLGERLRCLGERWYEAVLVVGGLPLLFGKLQPELQGGALAVAVGIDLGFDLRIGCGPHAVEAEQLPVVPRALGLVVREKRRRHTAGAVERGTLGRPHDEFLDLAHGPLGFCLLPRHPFLAGEDGDHVPPPGHRRTVGLGVLEVQLHHRRAVAHPDGEQKARHDQLGRER